MISATQQHDSASQPEASPQAQHPHYLEALNDSNLDKYTTASDADGPDAWQVQPVSHTDQQHEWSAVDQEWTDNLESMPEEDFQHSLPLHGYVLTQHCGQTSSCFFAALICALTAGRSMVRMSGLAIWSLPRQQLHLVSLQIICY